MFRFVNYEFDNRKIRFLKRNTVEEIVIYAVPFPCSVPQNDQFFLTYKE